MSWLSPITVWWQQQTDQWTGKAPSGAKRSPKWPKVREAHLKTHPRCVCCGGTKKLRVHHAEPFHVNPERELDPENLMTLCESGKYGINCHLLIGHLGNWRRWNPLAVLHAKQWNLKLTGKCEQVAKSLHMWAEDRGLEGIPSLIRWMLAIMFLWLASVAHAGSGIYSLEQECRTGNCPLTAGPATCVCVGHTPDGRSCILTAAHCVSQASNRFYAVGSSGQRYPATVVFRDNRLDLAALSVSSKLSRAKVRMSPPGQADMVLVSGLLTRRFQESSGYLDRVDSNGRIWSRKLWSHPGMSGGAMTDDAGRLFGIHTAKVTGSDETLAAPIKPAIEAFQKRYGRLAFESGSLITQQGLANCIDCRSRSRSVVRSASSYCPCPQTPSPAASAPARVSVSVDYERISREFFARYGERLRGRDGVNGRDGSPGKDGGRGAQGQKGDQGPRGLTGVPSESEVRKWLQMYATEIEIKESPQRVLIVDGDTKTVLDDETFAPGEPIVLDIRRLKGGGGGQ